MAAVATQGDIMHACQACASLRCNLPSTDQYFTRNFSHWPGRKVWWRLSLSLSARTNKTAIPALYVRDIYPTAWHISVNTIYTSLSFLQSITIAFE